MPCQSPEWAALLAIRLNQLPVHYKDKRLERAPVNVGWGHCMTLSRFPCFQRLAVCCYLDFLNKVRGKTEKFSRAAHFFYRNNIDSKRNGRKYPSPLLVLFLLISLGPLLRNPRQRGSAQESCCLPTPILLSLQSFRLLWLRYIYNVSDVIPARPPPLTNSPAHTAASPIK